MFPALKTGQAMNAETGPDKNTADELFADLDWRLVPEARPLSVSEQIAERISQAILLGEYQPGQRIPEQSIADQYQVSRGPVREALRLLERDAVIEILPRRGAQVTSLSVKEVTDIFNIRASLIGLCVRLMVENLQPDQISQIEVWVARLGEICSKSESTEEYLSISFRLSLYISRNSGNERLYDLVRSLSRQTVRYTALGLATPERRQRSAKVWRTMLKAIHKHDGEAAERACLVLVGESRAEAIRRLKSTPASQEDAPL
jgi:DNA-binding GntR family transcriptional regulator